ncbi:hypothetical protein PybrP1_008231 [[Pythium] brassicae (nom. inval.)]|nr:hypothetical protein PybrP1_008231 [[Pythium] brassicae (nom. inval.)]
MELFVPYVYAPSADAAYVMIVTPFGALRVDKQVAWRVIFTASVLLATALLYRVCFGGRRASATGSTPSRRKPDESSSEDEHDDDKHDDGRSALDESLLRKGEHSYYYAHQRRVSKSESADDALKKTMVSTYGWVDGKATVNIYLRDDAVVDMKEEQLVLKWTKTSFSLDLLSAPGGDQAKSLVIPALFSDIKDVTWRTKKNQLTLTLVKSKAAPWKSLNGAAKNLEAHIEYDASLYD